MIKESLLNVLMYVFENYMDDNIHIKHPQDVAEAMLKDGFEQQEVSRALAWFTSLSQLQQAHENYYCPSQPESFRIYSDYECNKITDEARQFLQWMEASHVIDGHLREIIIHHSMALDEPLVDLPEIKWVSLMALFGQPGKKTQLALLEDMILFDDKSKAH